MIFGPSRKLGKILFVTAFFFTCWALPLSSVADENHSESEDGDSSADKADAAYDRNLGSFGDQEVQGFTGEYVYNYPLNLPEYFGVTPSLKLTYRSQGGNGLVGLGWTLEGLSKITRMKKRRGTAQWEAHQDRFYIDGLELLPCDPNENNDVEETNNYADFIPSCDAGGSHFTRKETYSRIAFNSGDVTWTVTNKDGLELEFQIGHVTTSGIWTWVLKKSKDLHGNQAIFEWTPQAGTEMPTIKAIRYGDTVVTFNLESRLSGERGDPIEQGTGAGFATLSSRLQSIFVHKANKPLKAFQLTYTNAGVTSRSKLERIDRYGRDFKAAAGQITSGSRVPSVVFRYWQSELGFEKADGWALPGSVGSQAGRDQKLVDLTGDGLVDYVQNWSSSASQSLHLTYVNQGDGTWQKREVEFPISHSANAKWVCAGCSFDINGDGLNDFVADTAFGHSFVGKAYLNKGDFKFEFFGQYGVSGLTNVTSLDVNGDGLVDAIYKATDIKSQVLRGDGKGGLRSFGKFPIHVNGVFKNPVAYVDYNGDGLIDADPVCGGQVAINTGVSFNNRDDVTSVRSEPPRGCGTLQSYNRSWIYRDLNGDGLTDRFPFGAEPGLVSRGFQMGYDDVPADILGQQVENLRGVALADVNGDGAVDVLTSHPKPDGVNTGVYLSKVRPELIREVALVATTGKTTTVQKIDYAPATKFSNKVLPFVRWVVEAQHAFDGRGGQRSTRFAYAGGWYDGSQRQFMGFRYVLETLPRLANESHNPTRETWFFQDPGTLSKPERIHLTSGDGVLVSAEEYLYDLNGGTLPYTSHLQTERHFEFDSSGQSCPQWEQANAGPAPCEYGRRTIKTYASDRYGNVVGETYYGDFDQEGDEKEVNRVFAYNKQKFILNRSALECIKDLGTGQWIRQTMSVYDGIDANTTKLKDQCGYNEDVVTALAGPTRGNLTASWHWLNYPQPMHIVTKYEYDGHGNRIKEISPDGATTQTFFNNPSDKSLETKTVNALGHNTEVSWDATCRQPLIETDANGHQTQRTYDEFCRLRETLNPDGGFERINIFAEGDPSRQYVETLIPGSQNNATVYRREYFDHGGFHYRTERQGANPDKPVLVERSYNARGLLDLETFPFFQDERKYHKRNEYDANDRIVKVVLPDGTHACTFYSLFIKEETEETAVGQDCQHNRRKTRHREDGLGRLVERSELLNGIWVSKHFEYNEKDELVRMRDEHGNTWSITYDSLGRRLRLEDPDSGLTTFEYDSLGRVVKKTDNRKTEFLFEYDLLGRKTKETTRLLGQEPVTVEWRYDENHGTAATGRGRLTSMISATNGMRYIYSKSGRVLWEESKILHAGQTRRFIREKTYDLAGRLVNTIYGSGIEIARQYDEGGALASIPGFVEQLDYNAPGQLLQARFSNGTRTTNRYVPERMWLAESKVANAGGELFRIDISHRDTDGRVLTEDASVFRWSYTYDDLGRLTGATASDGFNQAIAYDAIGNITHNSLLGDYSYEPVVEPDAGGDGDDNATDEPVYSWQNPRNKFDVNDDGSVTPTGDVLKLVNHLNATGGGEIDSSVLPNPAEDTYFLDVNGDGHVTPGDVLMLINFLNGVES